MKQQIYLLTTLLLLNVASGCAKNPVEEDNPGNVPYIEVSVIDYGAVGDD